MAWQLDADSATIQVLQTFNHKPEWHQVKPPATVKIVMGHMRNFNSDEIEYINAYGTHGVEVICRASDFTNAPEKFDRFKIDGELYTIQDVRTKRGFNNSALIYRCLCKGF